MTILIILAVLIAFLLYLPVGVDMGYTDSGVILLVRIGAVTLRLFPRKHKKPKQKKPAKGKKSAQKAQSADQPKQKKKLNVTWEEIQSALDLTVRSIRKLKFRVRKLMLHFTSAFDDPYTTAMVYGYANAAASALGLYRVRGGDVQLSADFTSGQWTAEAYISITIRIFYMIKFAFSLLFGGLKLLLRRRRRIKQEQTEIAQAAGKEA